MNIAIITAGGIGSRMGNKIPKQFIDVNGKPIIAYTIDTFERHQLIDAIVVVCLKEWMEIARVAMKRNYVNKVVRVVEGGDEGQQSIYNGLLAARDYAREAGCDNPTVLVHDAVRPMVTTKLITDCINATATHGNAIVVAQPTETFIIENEGQRQLLDRDKMHIVRAPQCFRLNDILQLHERAIADGKTDFRDCCSMLCDYDIPYHMVIGPTTNIKITFPSDVILFRSLLNYIEMQQVFTPPYDLIN
ncbi:MAG: 2-C-methyl-D-erythritol 4-phosphate cytidylyltransferase [Bacteroidales bacterium]|nr:2-C-methyl-D-erythritol 4-phosphate cytidylyltransferase [Candidatus Sodaliphilus limicaballi]